MQCKTNLHRIMQGHKVRAAELARRLDVTRQCVCNAKDNGIKTARIAKRYAAALGCDWRELLD